MTDLNRKLEAIVAQYPDSRVALLEAYRVFTAELRDLSAIMRAARGGSAATATEDDQQ